VELHFSRRAVPPPTSPVSHEPKRQRTRLRPLGTWSNSNRSRRSHMGWATACRYFAARLQGQTAPSQAPALIRARPLGGAEPSSRATARPFRRASSSLADAPAQRLSERGGQGKAKCAWMEPYCRVSASRSSDAPAHRCLPATVAPSLRLARATERYRRWLPLKPSKTL
jgi:hypothetical protein